MSNKTSLVLHINHINYSNASNNEFERIFSRKFTEDSSILLLIKLPEIYKICIIFQKYIYDEHNCNNKKSH